MIIKSHSITVALTLLIAGGTFAQIAEAADQPAPTAQTQPALTQAEVWVQQREQPWATQMAAESKKKKHPVRNFVKAVGKGAASEAKATVGDMAKDCAFVFSVQDIDPYDKSSPPVDKPAIVMEMNMIDGSTCYLHRFPDNSFAVEGGFADNTVMVPTQQHEFLIKYPNGAQGRFVRSGGGYKIYRSDNSVTTISKNPSGDYEITNDKIGFMGTAHPDETGLQYELGTW